VDTEIEGLLQLVPVFRGKDLAVSSLAGGITNRNYRIVVDGESYVLRVGGENTELLGIDRACEYTCAGAAAACGVGPEVIASIPEHAALITRFVEGQALKPRDAHQPDVLQRSVEALRRYHDGPPGAGSFSPFETVRDYYAKAKERRVPFPHTIGVAMDLLALIEEGVQSDEPLRPCHDDLLPANFIDDGERVWIIDWEYAGMGDRFFDLGNLAVNHELEEQQEYRLLELYFGEVCAEHLRRLRLMRLASDMRESLWGFLQAGISMLDFDFLGYGQTHLDRFLDVATSLDPQLFHATV
jgi:thiamine kinase-like enzyme